MKITPATAASKDFFAWEDANPLLQGLPRGLDKEGMRQALESDPLTLYPRPIPTNRLREVALQIRHRHVATPQEVKASVRLLELLIESMKRQDPRRPENKTAIVRLASLVGTPMGSYPWLQTGTPGAVIEGMTGPGKSAMVERFLSIFDPQVRLHGKSEEHGWLDMKQVVYLRVCMPTTPHPSGLLLEIALELDRLLGTAYAAELLRRGVSVDRQISLVLLWLRTHHVGVLVIEEQQDKNLTPGEYGKAFFLLFLRLLNGGTFTVLIGSPLALRQIKKFSQDSERFIDGLWLTMWPTFLPTQEVWTKFMIPGLWGWTMLEPDELIPNLESTIFKATGGLTRHVAILRRETLLEAIADGSERVRLIHFERALQSPHVLLTQTLTTALVKRDKDLLALKYDVPVEDFVAQWNLIARAEQLKKEQQARRKSASRPEPGSTNESAEPVPPSLAGRLQDAGADGPSDRSLEAASGQPAMNDRTETLAADEGEPAQTSAPVTGVDAPKSATQAGDGGLEVPPSLAPPPPPPPPDATHGTTASEPPKLAPRAQPSGPPKAPAKPKGRAAPEKSAPKPAASSSSPATADVARQKAAQAALRGALGEGKSRG